MSLSWVSKAVHKIYILIWLGFKGLYNWPCDCLIRTKEGTKEAGIAPESADVTIFSSRIKYGFYCNTCKNNSPELVAFFGCFPEKLILVENTSV